MRKISLLILPIIFALGSCGGTIPAEDVKPKSSTDLPYGGEVIEYVEPSEGEEQGERSEYELSFYRIGSGVYNTFYERIISAELDLKANIDFTIPDGKHTWLIKGNTSGKLEYGFSYNSVYEGHSFTELHLKDFSLKATVQYDAISVNVDIKDLNINAYYISGSILDSSIPATLYLDLSDESVSKNLINIVDYVETFMNLLMPNKYDIDFELLREKIQSICSKYKINLEEVAEYVKEQACQFLTDLDPMGTLYTEAMNFVQEQLQSIDLEELLASLPLIPEIRAYLDENGDFLRTAIALTINELFFESEEMESSVERGLTPLRAESTEDVLKKLDGNMSIIVGVIHGSSVPTLEETHFKANAEFVYGTANAEFDLDIRYGNQAKISNFGLEDIAQYNNDGLPALVELAQYIAELVNTISQSL